MAGAVPKGVFLSGAGEARAVGLIAEEAIPLTPAVRVASGRSIAGSVAVHGLILLTIAMALRGRTRPVEPVIEFEVGVVTEAGAGGTQVEATAAPRDLTALRDSSRRPGGAGEGTPEPGLETLAARDRGPDPGSETHTGSKAGRRRDVIGMGEGDGGSGSGREVAGGGAAGSLWGVGAGQTPDAASFVYVLDRSGSMQDTFPLLEAELRQAIGSLRAGQSFDVIWFSEGPSDAVSPTMMAATTENKLRTLEAVRRVTPAGRTQPMDALQRGLAMRPDVLYLLSDGDFGGRNDDLVELVRRERAGGSKTTIHTILFRYGAGRDGEAALRRIAEVGGGTYKHIGEERLGG